MGLFGRDSQPSPPISQPSPKAAHSGGPQVEATIIARGTRFEGKLSGATGITIDGELDGTIAISGNLQISVSGRVKATVRARSVSVSGHVTGDIAADEKIQLEESAVVQGDLCSPRILIMEGATLQGKVEMNKPKPVQEKAQASEGPKVNAKNEPPNQKKKK
ncbi:MAG: polymer-forming cytoskeletal protein [Thermoanaerobaculales bacterium]|nr:polymer-forming cytoskeletal protein [Thermoanaerobaculales bacterium]